MKKHQRTNNQLYNCSKCLLQYIRWKLLILMSCISGIITYYVFLKHILFADTAEKALHYYFSCPLSPNLLQLIACYISIFIPIIFSLHFLDMKICTEYYLVRLKRKIFFVFSKIICVAIINLTFLLIKLFIFIVSNILFPPLHPAWINTLILPLVLALLVYITFSLAAFLFFSFTRSTIITFILFSVLFLFSLYFTAPVVTSFFFWIYGLNFSNINLSIICKDFVLAITIVIILTFRHYDTLTEEAEKNE